MALEFIATNYKNTDYFIPKSDYLNDPNYVSTSPCIIHDNGGRPFIVEINDNIAKIYDNTDNKELLLELSFVKIFYGKEPVESEYENNSLLLQIALNEYVYIGSVIYKFYTDDEIIDYYSIVGNSDVPYPYAIGTKYTYLMIEYIKISTKLLYETSLEYKIYDPYNIYYFNKDKIKYNDKKFNNDCKLFRGHILIDRRY